MVREFWDSTNENHSIRRRHGHIMLALARDMSELAGQLSELDDEGLRKPASALTAIMASSARTL